VAAALAGLGEQVVRPAGAFYDEVRGQRTTLDELG